MPVLATFFTVRRGRDPFFKFFMQKLFPKQVKRYEEEFGMRFTLRVQDPPRVPGVLLPTQRR